jgi:glycine/D-amino acid oxidase-like deaminating enzyme
MGGPPVFTHTGFLHLVGPPYAEALRKNVEMLRGIGVNTLALTPSELKGLQPFTSVDDIGAAAYEPDSGYADPAGTVEGFRRRAQELGARILQWTTASW